MSGASILPGQVAARVVPDSDLPARLTVFAAAFLAFLTVLALGLTLAATHVAARWEQDLSQSATIRLPADDEDAGARVQAAMAGFAGVASTRVLTAEEHRALLAPWLGADVPVDALPLPVTIAVEQTEAGPDADALRARLAEVSPGAVYDDHAGWRDPIHAAATRLRLVAVAALVLIAATLATMVVLAAQAALAANGRVIEVLRLVGARDAFIVAAFTRRFTLRATIGAAVGAALGTGAVVLAGGLGEAGLFGGPVFVGANWFLPLALPPATAALAFLATRWAARRTLRDIA